jgi:hypothetical protein
MLLSSLFVIWSGDSTLLKPAERPPVDLEYTSFRVSYARKLVTAISSGVFDLLDPVLERHSFDDVGEMA